MRTQGWESLLYAHILEAKGKSFAWGDHDCVLWAGDWVDKATGTSLTVDFRGTYSTEEGGNQALASLGFASVGELASHYLPETPVKKAQRGDIMLHPQGMLGICDGAHAYFVTHTGLTRIPFTMCQRAWKVG